MRKERKSGLLAEAVDSRMSKMELSSPIVDNFLLGVQAMLGVSNSLTL